MSTHSHDSARIRPRLVRIGVDVKSRKPAVASGRSVDTTNSRSSLALKDAGHPSCWPRGCITWLQQVRSRSDTLVNGSKLSDNHSCCRRSRKAQESRSKGKERLHGHARLDRYSQVPMRKK